MANYKFFSDWQILIQRIGEHLSLSMSIVNIIGEICENYPPPNLLTIMVIITRKRRGRERERERRRKGDKGGGI